MLPEEKPVIDKSRVFVVHGRNEELRSAMFDFLRAIGLKPIEWSQAVSITKEGSPYVGDVLDKAMQYVQAVVVLFSGDDEARLNEDFISENTPDYDKNLTRQPRPNVLFEAGLAFGRFPTRTVLVEVGILRPFSDIAGRHTVRLNNSTKARQELAQRLAVAGCTVDLSGTDWHRTGNFESIELLEEDDPSHQQNEIKSFKQDKTKDNIETIEKESNVDEQAILSIINDDPTGITTLELRKASGLSEQRLGTILRILAANGNILYKSPYWFTTSKGKKRIVMLSSNDT